MRRKGQAAMEFLMTYGWAILAAIIAIGVLAYFGVFSPGQYVGSSAVVTAPFYAEAWNVNTSNVNIELRNNGGEDLNVTTISLDVTDGADSCTDLTPSATINASTTEVYAVSCTNMESAGSTFRADVTITYRRGSSSLDLTSTGSITDTIA